MMADTSGRWIAGFVLVALLTMVGLLQGAPRVLPRAMDASKLPLRLDGGGRLDVGWLGGKPAVLHLWLPGCGTCASEAADIERARVLLGDEAAFVSVSVVRDPAITRHAAAAYGLGGVGATTTGNLLADLGVQSVPSTAFVDASGLVFAVIEGPVTTDELVRTVRELP
ncbi:MAG: Redoxin [Pseudomonadota bacterium]